jgi:hypothetical protein
MRLLLLSFVFLTFGFSVAQSNSENSSQTNVIQEPKPKYTEDIAKEEKKLSKKEKAKLKKLRAPRKAEPQKSTEDQIKDEDQSDLTPPE